MSYRTIVVGTDGSPTASVAVEVAQKLAKRLHGKLVLVGALDAYGVTRQPLQTAFYEAAEAARAKKVDAIVAFRTEEPGILAAAGKAGVQVDRFLFSDFGVDYYSIGFIVNDETLAKRPEMVKRFLAAVLSGYAFAFKNPQAAADMFIKRFPESNRDLSFAQWQVSGEHVLTDRTRANGLGYIDRAKMQHTLDLITKYQDVKQAVGLDDIYSSSVLTKIEVGN